MSDGFRAAAAGSGGGDALTYFTALRAFLIDSMRYPWDAVPSLGGSVPAIRALDKLEDILASSENFLQKMHERGNDPHQHKQLNRLFSPSEAAEMVGRDRTTLARAEAELGMESLQRNPQNNRRVGYSLQQVQDFRRHFGTLPWRDGASDPAL